MFRSLKFVAIALATLLVVEPAIAQYQPNNRAPTILRKLTPQVIKPNLNLLPEVGIAPSQAAAIAQAQVSRLQGSQGKARGEAFMSSPWCPMAT